MNDETEDQPPIIDEEMAARTWALTQARDIVKTTGFGSARVDTSDVLRVAEWIISGHNVADDWSQTPAEVFKVQVASRDQIKAAFDITEDEINNLIGRAHDESGCCDPTNPAGPDASADYTTPTERCCGGAQIANITHTTKENQA